MSHFVMTLLQTYTWMWIKIYSKQPFKNKYKNNDRICFCAPTALFFFFFFFKYPEFHIKNKLIKTKVEWCVIFVRWCKTFCWRSLSVPCTICTQCLISATLFLRRRSFTWAVQRWQAERCCASSTAVKHAVLLLTVKPPTALCLL